MKNLIRGHIYQLEKRQFLFWMSCFQLGFSVYVDPIPFSGGLKQALFRGQKVCLVHSWVEILFSMPLCCLQPI